MVTIDEKINEARVVLGNLICCESLHFEKLKQTTLEQVGGVYVIFDKNNSALYIGRTKNLRQRLYNNHLHGPTSNARLKKYLIADSQISEVIDIVSAKDWIKKNCYDGKTDKGFAHSFVAY